MRDRNGKKAGRMLLLAALSLTAPRLALAAAPVSWWPGEGTAADAAGGNNGILYGGTTFTAGRAGQGFGFFGLNNGIKIPDSESLKITGSLTISAWVKVLSYPASAQLWSMVLFRGDDRFGLDPYFLGVRYDGVLVFHVESLTAVAEVLAPIPLNRFVQVTASLDDATGRMRLYLNGALAAAATTSVRPFKDLDSGSNPAVGIGNVGGYPTTPHHFPLYGVIDELKLYNTVVKPPVASDFNGDGKPDLLWQHQTDGAVVYWTMDGVRQTGAGFLLDASDTAWKIVGTPDLNGDGKSDLLWQNVTTGDVVYWTMNGVSRVGGGVILSPGNPVWRIVGTPDLNGDGKPDLLWQYLPTGEVAYWLLDGTAHIGSGTITSGSPEWLIVGTPDLNGDGKPDLLWQNQTRGDVVYWTMNGVSHVGGGVLVSPGNPLWQIVGTADLNDDDLPDLLWEHRTTGDVVYWLNGGAHGYIALPGNPLWKVVAPR